MSVRAEETPSIDPITTLRGLLRAHGRAVGDFEFETHESGFQELFGGGGILAVRCRSTGEERLYATGPDSAWLGAFLMDLGAGHFAAFSRDVV
ncbi:MAG: hypothetical protein ABIS28_08380 [Caldimonas sp.]